MIRKPLSEIADIQTGPFGSQLHKDDYVEFGTPIVTVEHLGHRVFTEQNLPKVSPEDKQRLNKYVLSEGDIVFSRVGSVDRCSYVDSDHDGWMFSGRCLRVRPNEEINSLFLYYFFCLEDTKQFVSKIAVGATMPSINTKLMGEIPIVYPDLDIQTKIAEILSRIDDKIETNDKINQNLYEQIQTIYCKDFDPALNEVTGVLSDICKLSTDKVQISDLSVSTYYSTENMQPNKAGAVDASSLPSVSQTTRCRKGDVLVSNIRPYFKKIVYVTEECGCSTDVLCFVPQPDYSAFLFGTLYMDRFFDYMVAGSKGTKMPRGDKQQIMKYPIVVPTAEAIIDFNAVVIPMLEQITINNKENRRLATMRDTLLPRLMSGELDVSEIEL